MKGHPSRNYYVALHCERNKFVKEIIFLIDKAVVSAKTLYSNMRPSTTHFFFITVRKL